MTVNTELIPASFFFSIHEIAYKEQISDMVVGAIVYAEAFILYSLVIRIRGITDIYHPVKTAQFGFGFVFAAVPLYGAVEHILRLFNISGFKFIPGLNFYTPAAWYFELACICAIVFNSCAASLHQYKERLHKEKMLCEFVVKLNIMLAIFHALWFIGCAFREADTQQVLAFITESNGYSKIQIALAHDSANRGSSFTCLVSGFLWKFWITTKTVGCYFLSCCYAILREMVEFVTGTKLTYAGVSLQSTGPGV